MNELTFSFTKEPFLFLGDEKHTFLLKFVTGKRRDCDQFVFIESHVFLEYFDNLYLLEWWQHPIYLKENSCFASNFHEY